MRPQYIVIRQENDVIAKTFFCKIKEGGSYEDH